MKTIIKNQKQLNQVNEQITLVKPTIQEIFQAYINSYKAVYEYEHDSDYDDPNREEVSNRLSRQWDNCVKQNTRYLSAMSQENFNIVNFNRVIASIELDGAKHFNMQVFMGTLTGFDGLEEEDVKHYQTDNFATVSSIHSDYIQPLSFSIGELLSPTTKAFNCNSIGCVAGFAVANALDWDENLIAEAMQYLAGQKALFEQVACNFLNMPVSYGMKLFYGERNSFWHFLKGLSYENPGYSELEKFKEIEYAYDDNEEGVELSSINYKMAATALKLIRDGHIYIDESDSRNIDISPKFANALQNNLPIE